MSRILIVDDEPSVREVLTALLADEGHAVHEAPDGCAALGILALMVPDLLITDVMMPGLDGWSLLTRVREHIPALPVIVISAVDRPLERPREVFRTDHTVFLRKPFDIEIRGCVCTVRDAASRLTPTSPMRSALRSPSTDADRLDLPSRSWHVGSHRGA